MPDLLLGFVLGWVTTMAMFILAGVHFNKPRH